MALPIPSPADDPNRDGKVSCDGTTIKSPTASDDSTPMKPDFTYNALIIMAIKNSPDKKLTIHEICDYIQINHPFYRNTTLNWKNFICHNLSIYKCFVKVKRAPGEKGHGGYWTLAENYEDAMLDRRGRCRGSRAKKSGGKASTMTEGVSAPTTTLGLDEPTNPLGVNPPRMLPAYLSPTPMPPNTPNPFFGVGAPIPFIPTPMMIPATNLDFQVIMEKLRERLQQH